MSSTSPLPSHAQVSQILSSIPHRGDDDGESDLVGKLVVVKLPPLDGSYPLPPDTYQGAVPDLPDYEPAPPGRPMSSREMSNLFQLLDVTTMEQSTFEGIGKEALNLFPDSSQHHRLCAALVQFLMYPDLLTHQCQRISCIYLLLDLYKARPVYNHPFASVFAQYLNVNQTTDSPHSLPALSALEKQLLIKMLTSMKEIQCMTPLSAIRTYKHLSSTTYNYDLSSLSLSLLEKLSALPKSASSGIPRLFPAPTSQNPRSDPYMQKPSEPEGSKNALKQMLSNGYTFLSMSPELYTPPPPLYPIQPYEMAWLNPDDYRYTPAWEPGLCTQPAGSEIRRIMSRAFRESLTIPEQQSLIDDMNKDKKLVYHLGLTPNKLPSLVENNPMLAIEMLLKLMQSTQITEYFSILVSMELSLHSMEVVNRLTTAVELPQEFLHLYISNCIQTCETLKDKYMQNRLVRLVCVFLQSLIRNKIINVKDLYIEIQAFCIEFSQIREAAALFRLLKQIDEGLENSGDVGT